mmetsp:Transcript_33443/g.49089  ORF Transcript_33443/g.49089 Transcript_33443/m.49089 type:complete len:515 (+) Transcript_33443:1051-2595(+)
MVFLSIGALTLVAISYLQKKEEECYNYDEYETEAYLKLQLEYIYGQIIFTLTDQVQSIFERSPNFDLRSMLGATDAVMRGLLDHAGPCGNGGGSFLTAGVEMVSPLPVAIRESASGIIVQAAYDLACISSSSPLLENKKRNKKSIDNKRTPLFAMLLVGNKLITLVQPNYRPHQLHPSDLHLILNFVNFQPGLISHNELWFPFCLPRFHSSAFLYAYTVCFDPSETKLSLVLVSADGSTEQFEYFRNLSKNIRREIGIPKEEQVQRSALAMALKESLAPKIQDEFIRRYKDIASALHFVFRCDVVINNSPKTYHSGNIDDVNNVNASVIGNSNGNSKNGMLTQCLSPPLGFPFVDAKSKRRVWNAYQRLSLRLRLGSASFESTMDAFDMIVDDNGSSSASTGDDASPEGGGGGGGDGSNNHNNNSSNPGLGGIGRHCPAQCLMESPPNVHGVSYALDGTELFIGLNGKDFELYATLPGTITPRNGSALCARLVRRLMLDERILFLANPPTWRNS